MDVEQADEGFEILFLGVTKIQPHEPPILGRLHGVINGRNVRKLSCWVDEKEAGIGLFGCDGLL